ncbi:MAG: ester cyclase [Ktedonobacteraceae bacterium]|nr:ester cyclase [Ktedonobacteraceae bacterium]MBV8823322.1 ester cyclase [Ktedonobacteraceae bacterium]
MPPQQNQQIMQQITEAFNTGNEAIIDQLVDPAHTDHTPFPSTSADREGLKRQIRAMRQAFPDAQFSIEQMTSQGETVNYTWKMVGTNRGQLMGHGPTNKQVTHTGTGTVTFRNGKIVEHQSQDNLDDLLGKLGLPPLPHP